MSIEKLKRRAFKNTEVKAEYEKLESEFKLIDELLSMRASAGLTQEQLAEKMQTKKSNVSRLETGNTNPSWSTLRKYADACGFELSLHSHKV